MMRNPYRALFLSSISTAFAIMSLPILAADWAVSGYGSLGYSYENEENLGYLRNLAQPDDYERNGSYLPDSNIGVQFDVQLNPEWSVTTQWVLEDRVEQ